MNMSKNYVLFLVHIDDGMCDLVGNKYPKSGFIKAKRFEKNNDLRNGLCGILWGKASKITDRTNFGKWVVVKTENNNLVRINGIDTRNAYKFPNGIIMHMGNIKSCGKFIFKSLKQPSHYFSKEAEMLKEEEIVGTKMWKGSKK